MKKLLSILSVLLFSVMSVSALTLKEGFDKLNNSPELKGIVQERWNSTDSGWLGGIPIDSAMYACTLHEVGNSQTVYYGTKLGEVVSQLPSDELILSGENPQNLIYIYAAPIDAKNSQLLILVDQAYQGYTAAVIGTVNNKFVEVLKGGKIEFTANHEIILSAPLFECS